MQFVGAVELKIDFTAGVPIYRQVVNQLRYLVALGRLEPDKALPSIRTLAHHLQVAPNTIAKAYEELAVVGLVHKRRGFGTYVSLTCPRTVDRARQQIIEQRIDALLAIAHELNLNPETLIELMHRRQAFMASRQAVAEPLAEGDADSSDFRYV
jgi:GntR family transcriptional regulator